MLLYSTSTYHPMASRLTGVCTNTHTPSCWWHSSMRTSSSSGSTQVQWATCQTHIFSTSQSSKSALRTAVCLSQGHNLFLVMNIRGLHAMKMIMMMMTMMMKSLVPDVPYYFLGGGRRFCTPVLHDETFQQVQHDPPRAHLHLPYLQGKKVVENAFGILANRWRCMMNMMQQPPDVVQLLVECCVVLHNLLRIRMPAIHNVEVDREDEHHNVIEGAWKKKWWCFRPLLCTLFRLNWAKQTPGILRRN